MPANTTVGCGGLHLPSGTAATISASSGIATGTTDQRLRLIRKPGPTPKNAPSGTKLER